MWKLAQILEVVSSKPVIQEAVMLKCRLSTKTFNDNMDLLVNSHLVEVIPTEGTVFCMRDGKVNRKSKKMFYITAKGREFLHRYRNLIILLTAEKTQLPYYLIPLRAFAEPKK